ncbi:hypothetical protein DN31_3921 [Vibrio mimicus]|nr:hypothetical protein DN31_3921 [Vibrio mimicus]
MKSFIVVLCSFSLLAGCQLTRVEGKIDDVDVKVGTNESSNSNGKFCPPGQAKKGNC